MNQLAGDVRIDIMAPGAGPAGPRGPDLLQRTYIIEPPQRASLPYAFEQVVLTTGPSLPANSLGAALSVGPFVPRRAWSGAPDDRRETILLIALTNAQPGREQEFDDWYWDQHFPDGQRLPGCYAARRYALAEGGIGAFRHLALYQFDIDNLATLIDAHVTRAGTDQMPISSSVSPVFQAWYVRPTGRWTPTL